MMRENNTGAGRNATKEKMIDLTWADNNCSLDVACAYEHGNDDDDEKEGGPQPGRVAFRKPTECPEKTNSSRARNKRAAASDTSGGKVPRRPEGAEADKDYNNEAKFLLKYMGLDPRIRKEIGHQVG